MSKKQLRKCDPLKCDWFKARYEKVWDKFPADRLVVKCPYRNKDNTCRMEKKCIFGI